MKAIIQKDLRENFKVALIGLILFTLLLLQAYRTCSGTLINLVNHNSSPRVSDLQPLLAQVLQMEAVFFCAIFGATLGWLQTRNEAHRDLWAFLVHRPISRAEIFRGKALAGLCLYAMGTGLPLTGLILVVATPGHVAAPFEWGMVLPLLAILLTGPAYYFAGMLAGLRQARWYGSKCLGLGCAVAASGCVYAAGAFWQSLGMSLLVGAILAVVVQGAYQTGGYYRGLRGPGKFALITTMTVGCAMVFLIVVGLTVTFLVEPWSAGDSYEYSSYDVMRDGVIYKSTYSNNELVSVVDLDGKPWRDPKTGKEMVRQELNTHRAYGQYVASAFNPHGSWYVRRLVDTYPSYFSLWTVVDKKLWFVDRHGKLLGYDGVTRKFLGAIEPQPVEGAAPESFLPMSNPGYNYFNSSPEDQPHSLASARAIYDIDVTQRTARPIFTLTNDDEIGGFADARFSLYTDDGRTFRRILISTRKSIILLQTNGPAGFQMSYVPGPDQYPQVYVCSLSEPNGFVVQFNPDSVLNNQSGWKMPQHYEWVTADGHVTRTLDLPQPRSWGKESLPQRVATSFVPLVLLVATEKHLASLEHVLGLVWSLTSVAIGGWLTRRYQFRPGATAGWLIFIFALGVPGLLTLLCVQEWPARVACPNCQKLRAADRVQCEHCAAEFPAPEKNGTEIFAPLVKV